MWGGGEVVRAALKVLLLVRDEGILADFAIGSAIAASVASRLKWRNCAMSSACSARRRPHGHAGAWTRAATRRCASRTSANRHVGGDATLAFTHPRYRLKAVDRPFEDLSVKVVDDNYFLTVKVCDVEAHIAKVKASWREHERAMTWEQKIEAIERMCERDQQLARVRVALSQPNR